MRWNQSRSLLLGLLLGLATWALCAIATDDPYERPPISYSASQPKDAITRLKAELAAGSLKFAGDEKQVLRDLLKTLAIPPESQLLVFSKTSLQRDRIAPTRPRAIYFRDDVYVGWCPGGLAEVAAIDPALGPVFYRFDPRASQGELRFERDPDCLRCHGGAFVRDIPGLLARSVYTDLDGEPLTSLGAEVVDSLTAFEQRYGGWYVTGLHGSTPHRGNLLLRDQRQPTAKELLRGANKTSLDAFFDCRPYLARTSDLVALLVFEHQLTVQNALTTANQHCLALLAYQQGVQRELKNPVSEEPEFESVEKGFADAVQQVLDALLCKDEAPLPKGGVKGIGGFTEVFQKTARKNPAEPTLRDLDLQNRLLKYRCSYLITSLSFEGLQPVLRMRVLRRLWNVLSNPANDHRYTYLEPQERMVIRSIVERTVQNLPTNWKTKG